MVGGRKKGGGAFEIGEMEFCSPAVSKFFCPVRGRGGRPPGGGKVRHRTSGSGHRASGGGLV